MSTNALDRIVLAVVASLAVIALTYAFGFSPAAVQQRNMAKAWQHNQILKQLVAGDDRFVQVEFGEYTGLEGAGSASGTVATRADAEALEKLVRDSSPPRPILWSITVENDPEYGYLSPRSVP